MKLKEINKALYRSRLNKVIVGFIAIFAITAVVFGSILIALFSTPELLNSTTEQAPNNFKFNLLGVILALLACGIVLNKLKNTEFFTEIYYVWQLKQVQNIIFRRLKKIKQSSLTGDSTALLILSFYYQSLKQLYLLDDNTITLTSLNGDIEKLEQLIKQFQHNISVEQFDQSSLNTYK